MKLVAQERGLGKESPIVGGVAAEGSQTTKAEVACVGSPVEGAERRGVAGGRWAGGPAEGTGQAAAGARDLAGAPGGGPAGSAAWRGTTGGAVIRRRPSGGGSAGVSGGGPTEGTREPRPGAARGQPRARAVGGSGALAVGSAAAGRDDRHARTLKLGLSQIQLGLDDRWAPLDFSRASLNFRRQYMWAPLDFKREVGERRLNPI